MFGYLERVVATSVRSISLEILQFCSNFVTLDIHDTAQVASQSQFRVEVNNLLFSFATPNPFPKLWFQK